MSSSHEQQLIRLLSSKPVLMHKLNDFLEDYWESFQFSASLKNDSIRQYVADRVMTLLEKSSEKSPELQAKKLLHEVSRVRKELESSLQALMKDLDSGLRDRFGIAKEDTLSQMTVLSGQETKFFIRFSPSGKTICQSRSCKTPLPVTSIVQQENGVERELAISLIPALLSKESYQSYQTATHSYTLYMDATAVEEAIKPFSIKFMQQYLPPPCFGPINLKSLTQQITEVLVNHPEHSFELKANMIDDILVQFSDRMKREVEIIAEVKSIADKFLHEHLPPLCQGPKNLQFLSQKILRVKVDHLLQSSALQARIIDNLLNNFSKFMSKQMKVITEDLRSDEEFKRIFNLSSQDELVGVHVLKNKTYHQGKVPLLLEFNNGKKIVFKPRSLLPEVLLCGQEGLFAKAGLTGYRIYNKGSYGYSEYLENTQTKDSVFLALTDHPQSIEDVPNLKNYTEKFILMDKVGRLVGLSDIHSNNVITVGNHPFLIDVEVMMLPTTVEGYCQASGTSILYTHTIKYPAAAYKFYKPLDNSESIPKNRIWIQLPNGQFLDDDLATAILEKSFIKNYNCRQPYSLEKNQQIRESLPPQLVQEIDLAKEKLNQVPHRILLLGGWEATKMISLPFEVGFHDFSQLIRERAKFWGFELKKDFEKLVEKDFITDVENNDIPILYFHSGNQTLIYHGKEIST